MSNLEIEIAYPRHPLIKQHVEYYYILNPQQKHLHTSYLAYPNIHQPFIFFEQTDVKENAGTHLLQFNKNTSCFCGVLGRFLHPLPVTIEGNIRTINIIFKELGLNCFIKSQYSEIVKNNFQPFNHWNIDSRSIASLFYLPKKQLETQLDELLLQHYNPFINENLFEAIRLMKCKTKDYDLKRIEQALSTSRKTLFRMFITHTGISPTSFRRIVRFRQALNISKTQDMSLTQLAYEVNFTDQSHLIKELHKLTGDTPSAFIKTATYVNGSKFLIKPWH